MLSTRGEEEAGWKYEVRCGRFGEQNAKIVLVEGSQSKFPLRC